MLARLFRSSFYLGVVSFIDPSDWSSSSSPSSERLVDYGDYGDYGFCDSLLFGSPISNFTLKTSIELLASPITRVIATTAAGVAAYGLPPEVSKVEVENAAQHSVALVDCNYGVNAF
ncbi:unnamed protein product [Lactuca saligna]|uniref:Uncharacterized protein n=1 Tax=Lactuca saligna TaxID=75948 RepID=A0AA35VYJ6_LACSI|nr:unnamed protein product [Lactuca saligna]